MATTVLFQSPQGGTFIQGGTTVTLTTLDVSNVKDLRITYKHISGGSVTATVKLIHEAQGNNANITLVTLDTVGVSNLQTTSRVYPNFIGRRLRIEATAGAAAAAQNIVVIVLGSDS